MSSAKDGSGTGYRRPPASGQFKKGRSGNPKGRPKHAQSFDATIAKAARGKVIINENGTRKQISKEKAAALQLVNKAANGDMRALQTLMKSYSSSQAQPSNHGEPLGQADQEVIDALVARIRSAEGAIT